MFSDSDDDTMPNLAPGCKLLIVENDSDDITDDEIPNLKPFDDSDLLRISIVNFDIDTIKELFIVSNINDNIYAMLARPNLYPTLELLLEHNKELRDHISLLICNEYRRIYRMITEIKSVDNSDQINLHLLVICVKYLSVDNLLQDIFDRAIYENDLRIIDTLFTTGEKKTQNVSFSPTGYDVVSAFNKVISSFENKFYYYPIKFNTFITLSKYNIDIVSYVDKICILFYNYNDVPGLEFCLENGVDANDIITRIQCRLDIDTIKCLLNHGADINKLKLDNIKCIMVHSANFLVMEYLIENGLDVSNYLYDLIVFSIGYSTDATKYFINMGIGADKLNELLPIACTIGNIEIVKFLLENGADVHYNNNSILDFMHINYKLCYDNTDKWYKIVKILIKNGAISNDVLYTFCLYIANVYDCGFDKELFTYFLNGYIDPNDKLDPNIKHTFGFDSDVEYILDAIVYLGSNQLFKLCLKYGADPFINNHMPLQLAIKSNNAIIIKILLDLGSVVNSELEYVVFESTINLLNQYQINHKLRAK